MADEDFWSGLGAIVSTILAGLSWILSIEPLQTLFIFLTGALVTYFVQSRLQDRAEKRRLRIKYLEDFHIPLFLVIENIRKNFLLNLNPTGIGEWHTLIKRPEIFTLELEFRQQISDFLEKTQKLSEKLNAVQRVVAGIIYERVKQFLDSLKRNGVITIGKGLSITTHGEGTGLSLQLRNPYQTSEAPIAKCAILQRNPIQYLEEKHKTFEMDKLFLYIAGSYSNTGLLARQAVRTRVLLRRLRPESGQHWQTSFPGCA